MFYKTNKDFNITKQLLLISFVVFFAASCRHDPYIPTTPVYYDTQIQPVLTSNCAKSGCHGGGSGERRFDLSNYDAVMASGTVSAGKPHNSSMYTAITKWKGAHGYMPPKPNEPLSIEQIGNIFTWILQGAKNTIEPQGPCDSVNVTFSGVVWPVINTYCAACHNGNNPNTNVTLSGYSDVVAVAADTSQNLIHNLLLGDITFASGFHPMPQGGNKLSTCQIAQIRKWIKDGKPNN